MPLHPSLADRLHLLAGVDKSVFLESPEDIEPAVLERFTRFIHDGEWSVPPKVRIEDTSIAADHHRVPLRVYRPEGAVTRILVWAHGGGFVSGTLDWPESHVVSAELCARSGCAVVAVDYRLAPGWRYPSGIDDVAAAVIGVRRLLNADAETPVVLGGASAGAALALAAMLRHPEMVDLILLAYPFVHFPVPPLEREFAPAMAELPPVLRFEPNDIERMVQDYVGRLYNIPPDALPGAAKLMPGLPPARILVAEYDDLRPSGELLARQFQSAGIDTSVRMEMGVLHGHLNRVPGAAGVNESLNWFAAEIANASFGAQSMDAQSPGILFGSPSDE
jgi:acetyl esterase/lipase